VLAVDPSSPLTGGAILGDRIRMDDLAGDEAFIRSVATRGHSGGLALSVPGSVRAFDAAGYDPVIIETVGVGQVEVDVVGAADTTVVVVTPGWGDAVQANKAGLLEVADVFVVNKADRAGADDARRDLELMLELSHVTGAEDPTGRRPPIIMTTATEGDGATELWEAIDAHAEHLRATGTLTTRRAERVRFEILSRVDQALQERARALIGGELGRTVLADVIERDVSPASAGATIIASMLR
jgi:LAO/AO transport system kinase